MSKIEIFPGAVAELGGNIMFDLAWDGDDYVIDLAWVTRGGSDSSFEMDFFGIDIGKRNKGGFEDAEKLAATGGSFEFVFFDDATMSTKKCKESFGAADINNQIHRIIIA